MFEFLKEIPKGWWFYSCDWSIPNKCRITFIRTDEDRKKWHNLSDKDQELIDLYATGRGRNFNNAFTIGIMGCTPLEEDYQI